MLIFKKLKIAYEKQKGSEMDLRSVLIDALYKDMIGMYYLAYDKSKNNLRVLLENDFNFSKSAKQLSMSESSLRSKISYIVTQFEDYVGVGVVDIALDGDINLAMQRYKRADTLLFGVDADKLSSLTPYLRYIYNTTDKEKVKNYDIADCKKELKILGLNSLVRLNKIVDTDADKDKLVYLVGILMGNVVVDDVTRGAIEDLVMDLDVKYKDTLRVLGLD